MAAQKYQSIYKDLRTQILSGAYASRDQLEGEVTLCARYDVSRTTLRRALTLLKREGLVHSRQGSGVYVNPPELYGLDTSSVLASKGGQGEATERLVLQVHRYPAGRLAQAFSVSAMTPLVRYRMLLRDHGQPTALVEGSFPEPMVAGFDEADPPGTCVERLEQASGHVVSQVSRHVKARLASEWLADLLEVEVGSALLQVDHYAYLAHGYLLQHACELVPKGELCLTEPR